MVHVGSSFDDASNTRKLGGYVLVDVRASIPVIQGVELYGRIENLFDERYETAFRYGTPGRAAYGGIRLHYGATHVISVHGGRTGMGDGMHKGQGYDFGPTAFVGGVCGGCT